MFTICSWFGEREMIFSSKQSPLCDGLLIANVCDATNLCLDEMCFFPRQMWLSRCVNGLMLDMLFDYEIVSVLGSRPGSVFLNFAMMRVIGLLDELRCFGWFWSFIVLVWRKVRGQFFFNIVEEWCVIIWMFIKSTCDIYVFILFMSD